ncbi:hypothetical protein V1520DRAFT_279832 [Lipomyces starkeyi]|uniref:HNH nuclease domain-containing protein n=1 Tax=Lipomyces starkeyi NRRL Y-11557 TaxID=675824 RepID=A0A1E3Q0J8_LIPST|nr:hypothetical protein LIPSTDRAFT_5105 [Lipomyces starkeyi NRRL Y-11557]
MEDFNIPGAERVAQLKLLQEAIGDVSPYFWAACHVCHVEALKKLVKVASISPAIVRVFAARSRTMVRYWSPQPPKQSSQASTPKQSMHSNLDSSSPITTPPAKKQKMLHSPGSDASSPPLSRNRLARDLADERDNFRCVLTGDPSREIAHIYPFHSIKYKEEDAFGERHIFWDHLKNFWPEQKIADWELEIFPKGLHELGDEKTYNLITLSRTAHDMWARGAFALKPISVSNNNMTLKVQFFWQQKQTDIPATMSLLTTPFSTEHLDQNDGAFESARAVLYYADKRITSGQFFELHTNDPTTKPLPSFQLLEMQWFLQRVAGMAGGAGDIDSEDLDEDSDEEIPDLIPGDVGDSSLISIGTSSSLVFPPRGSMDLPHHSEHRSEEAEEGEEGIGEGNEVRVIM